ncbi:MAG: hypothetical protein ACYDA9_09375 [Terriglobia bacterium]
MPEHSEGAVINGIRENRRTPRLAYGVPIRVYATDFKGRDFVEDSTTLAVNLHGAKIRLGRELIPDQEIRILSGKTGRDAIFRVVCRAGDTHDKSTFWGVECMNPDHNIWGISFPDLRPRDQNAVRAMLQCPECRIRELLYLDEPILEKMERMGGLVRGCLSCGKTGQWKRVPYYEA